MNNYCVYIHTTPNNKKYVGITCRKPQIRWANGLGYLKNEHFYNAILKYGWDNIKHEILYNNLSKEEACKIEQELIQKYDTTNNSKGYNRSLGGESGGLGVVFTEERKKKIGETHKGMKHTETAKRKISEGHKGIITWNKGRNWTNEEKRTMMLAQKTKPIICIETNIIYESSREAERQTGINRNSIRDCCHERKHCKTAGGFHWKYVN